MNASQQHVIITDDDRNLREIMALALEAAGYVVHTANEGNEALELYPHYPGAVIFLDIFMPGMEGMETLLTFRRFHPAARIIAMSGGIASGSGSILNITSRLGAKAVLNKPFTSEAMLQTLQRVCGNATQ